MKDNIDIDTYYILIVGRVPVYGQSNLKTLFTEYLYHNPNGLEMVTLSNKGKKIHKLLSKINNRNQALLHCKHDNEYVRYHCRKILKQELTI